MGVDEINIPIHETNNSPSGERVSRLSQIVRPRVWFQQIVVTEEYHLHSRLCCNIDKHSSSRRVRWNIFISQSKDAKCLFAYVDGKNFSFILLMRFFPPQLHHQHSSAPISVCLILDRTSYRVSVAPCFGTSEKLLQVSKQTEDRQMNRKWDCFCAQISYPLYVVVFVDQQAGDRRRCGGILIERLAIVVTVWRLVARRVVRLFGKRSVGEESFNGFNFS